MLLLMMAFYTIRTWFSTWVTKHNLIDLISIEIRATQEHLPAFANRITFLAAADDFDGFDDGHCDCCVDRFADFEIVRP